jgi:hypothetical protein
LRNYRRSEIDYLKNTQPRNEQINKLRSTRKMLTIQGGGVPDFDQSMILYFRNQPARQKKQKTDHFSLK